MNCIAIDDEPLALNVIKDFCRKIEYLNLLATSSNAIDASRLLHEFKADLIFLDIQMPHINGLEFIKTLTNPPLIILTTAFSEHAVQGFELNVVDYLVKPISFERFLKAVNKASELYALRNSNIKNRTYTGKNDTRPEYMLIKVEYSTVRVNFKDILYIEGLKDYVKIYAGSKPLLTKSTLKHIEEKLPSDQFIRVHKSFIVSVSQIQKIENNRIVFGDKYIPVGDQYKENFYKLLDRFRL